MTLQLLSQRPLSVPLATSWLLSDLGEAKGRQDLVKKQGPERLRVLIEHALIQSAVSSNRIEGVVVEHALDSDRQKGVQRRVEPSDPLQDLAGDLQRRKLAAREALA